MLSLIHILLVVSYLSFSTYALPFLHPQPILESRAKYSVVAVDGSSNDNAKQNDPADPKPSTTTIISTLSHTITVTSPAVVPHPAPTTIVSTKTIYEEKPATTVVVTVTTTLPCPAAPSPKAKVAIINVDGDQSSPKVTGTVTTTLVSSSVPQSTTWVPAPVTTRITDLERGEPVSPQPSSKPCPEALKPTPVRWSLEPAGITPESLHTSTASKTFDDGKWHTTYRSWNTTLTTKTGFAPTVSGYAVWSR